MKRESNNEKSTVYLATSAEVTTLRQGGVELGGLIEGGFSGGQKEPVKITLGKTSDEDASKEFEELVKRLGIVIN